MIDSQEEDNDFNNLQYECYEWDKDDTIFYKQPNCTEELIQKESKAICETLDSFFVEYEIDENLNIKILLY